MKKSIGKQVFYEAYNESLQKDISDQEQRLFELRHGRLNLINIIEDKEFTDAYVVLPDHEPIEYMAYFYRVKDMQRHTGIDECRIVTANLFEHEHEMFLRGTLHNIMKYNRALKEAENRIEETKKVYEVPYDIYRVIIDTYDSELRGYLLDGKRYAIGSGIGNVYIKEKDRNYDKKVVNQEASKKEKVRIIANGLIPYRKEDAEKAEAEDREYKGVEWLIYYYDEKSYWLHWSKTKFIKNVILYSFVPTHGNNTGQSIYELQKEIKFNDIPKYKVGFKQMIHLCRRMNPKQVLLYRDNTINI